MSCIKTTRMTHINNICHCVSTNVWNTSIIVHVQSNQFLCTGEMSDDVTYLMFMVQFKHASITLFMFHTCNFIFFLLYVINSYRMAHLKVSAYAVGVFPLLVYMHSLLMIIDNTFKRSSYHLSYYNNDMCMHHL